LIARHQCLNANCDDLNYYNRNNDNVVEKTVCEAVLYMTIALSVSAVAQIQI